MGLSSEMLNDKQAGIILDKLEDSLLHVSVRFLAESGWHPEHDWRKANGSLDK
jgi:hypothetical protein